MPRRGENIYKRKDGRWEARFVKEITAEGKRNMPRYMDIHILRQNKNNSSILLIRK